MPFRDTWRVLRRHTSDRRAFERASAFAIEVLREKGLAGLAHTLVSATRRASSLQGEYERWIALHDSPGADDFALMRRRVAALGVQPLISVVMPVYDTPQRYLREAIESVMAQVYTNWELCIADDCSTLPHVGSVLAEYAARDARIKVVRCPTNGHISRSSNTALALASGEWVALLDHDDLLRPHSLFCVAEAIAANPGARLFYSDEDKIDGAGSRLDPYFKPDWNEGLFYGHNMFSHLGVYQRRLVEAAGGFRVGFEGAQDYDLTLRCIERIDRSQIVHIPHVLYHWRMIPGSTASRPGEKTYAIDAAGRALNEYFARNGLSVEVREMPGRGMTRAHFGIPDPAPSVEIVIPTRNGTDLLERCLSSLGELTDYPNYSVTIVDNGSDDPAALDYLRTIEAEGTARVLAWDLPFNFSAINNFAVARSTADFVCLLNNDTEIIDAGWLSELVGCALQPGVGVVGAMLLYPDDTIQHAGVVMGMTGVAGHIYAGQPADHAGMMCRAHLSQEMTAVTAACCLVRRSIYREVGGLDAENLAVAYNDVDFCLRVREAGYLNYWTPHARLYHHESMTRGYETSPQKRERFEREQAYMRRRWPDRIESDPAFNANLSLQRNAVGFAFPPRSGGVWRTAQGGECMGFLAAARMP